MRVCEMFDLETVSLPNTWAASLPAITGLDHAHPDGPLTVPEAHRIMRQHIGCRADACPRKASAHSCLIRAGNIVPRWARAGSVPPRAAWSLRQ
ncbi:hypothetical protein GCM10027089_41220 [Nocardia thraciensis]